MILAGNQKINYIYSASGEKLACDANGSSTYYRGGVMVYGADDKLLYMLTPEGTVSRSEGSAGTSYTYNYFKKDHIGSTRAVLSAVDDTLQSVQSTDYYPFGLAFSTNNLNKNKYLFSGKELQDGNLGGSMLGLYDFGARHYDPFVARWLKQDRYAAKYASASPYSYCLNNPVTFIDHKGDSITLRGQDAQNFWAMLQSSSSDITFTVHSNGTVDASYENGAQLSKYDQMMLNAITDPSVHVYVTITNSIFATTPSGERNLFVGGAFMGNQLGYNSAGNAYVNAYQTVNLSVLRLMSNSYGKPGQDLAHEITEAYQGGLLSLKYGCSASIGSLSNALYLEAHDLAIPQSGSVEIRFYDDNGHYSDTITPSTTRVEWWTNPTSGGATRIQSLTIHDLQK